MIVRARLIACAGALVRAGALACAGALVFVAALAGVAALGLASAVAAEPGVTATEIVIGCSTSLSGPLAFTGEQGTKFGIDLFVKALADAGGIHGRKIRTIYYDDAYEPDRALANTRTLVERDHVFAIVAPLGTSPVAATLSYLESQRVPLVFPLQDSAAIRGRKDVIAGTMLADRQAQLMVDYLVGAGHGKRFGILYHANAHGREWFAALEKRLARHRLKFAAAESLQPGIVDVTAAVARLRAAKPEFVFLAVTPVVAAQALKERMKIGWTDTAMVAAGPAADERYLGVAAGASDGVQALSLWPEPQMTDLPALRLYRERIAKYFPKNEPNRYSLAGYFAAMLFAEGVQRAGPELTRETFMGALASLKDWDSGILPPLTIGRDHETQKQAFWVIVDKGRFKPVTGWLSSEEPAR